MLMAPGKGFEPLRAKGPLAGLSKAQAQFVQLGSRGQRDNHSATPARIKNHKATLKTFPTPKTPTTHNKQTPKHTPNTKTTPKNTPTLVKKTQTPTPTTKQKKQKRKTTPQDPPYLHYTHKSVLRRLLPLKFEAKLQAVGPLQPVQSQKLRRQP